MSTATLTRTRRAAMSYAALPVAVYTRVSKDRGKDQGKGSGLAVERQEGEGRTYVERTHLAGADVVVYSDNDRSGWDPAIVRPGFEAMLDDVRAGKLRAVVAWHVDRFSRQPAQHELLWAACKESGTELHTVLGGHVASPLMLRIMSALAAEESDVKSERQKLKHGQLAEGGHFHGGKRRFGYELDMTVRESEADVIRQLAGKLLNGETLAACVRWLDANEVPTPLGGKWTGPNLGTMMKRPHLAGLRVHRKGREDESLTTASWEPILDRATHEALVVKLSDPKRRTSFSNARVYLLAGLAVCGECGAKVRGQRQGTGARLTAGYGCPECHGVFRNVEATDYRVTGWVVRRLAMLDARGVLADDTAAVELDRLSADRAALADRESELGAMASRGELSPKAYANVTAGLEAEAERLDAALALAREAVSAPVRALDGLTGPDPKVAFVDLPLGRQRAVIDVLCTVTVGKAVRRGSRFDETSIVVQPRGAVE